MGHVFVCGLEYSSGLQGARQDTQARTGLGFDLVPSIEGMGAGWHLECFSFCHLFRSDVGAGDASRWELSDERLVVMEMGTYRGCA